MTTTGVIAALLVLVGTAMQAWTNLRELAAMGEADTFDTVDRLKHEVPWYRFRRRRLHLRDVADLLKSSPGEAADYRRIRRTLWGWTILAMGALMGLLAAFGL